VPLTVVLLTDAGLELPPYHLNEVLTDDRVHRVKIPLVLLASGHGIGRRVPGR
jgi:hypothetical protein